MGLTKHSKITEKIIKGFYTVYNSLGFGFSEKVYENALVIELQKLGLQVDRQPPIRVYYGGTNIGNFYSDLLVENKVIVELKSVKTLIDSHEAQLLNYLKCTKYEVGLLLNFGPKANIKRKLFDNSIKGTLNWIENENH